MKTNPELSITQLQGVIAIIYPTINVLTTTTNSNLSDYGNTMNNRFPYRLYKIHASLLVQGGVKQVFHNCENLELIKWDGGVELLINNEILKRVNVCTATDDWLQLFGERYTNSFLNSKRDIQHHDVVVYNFDTTRINGSKWEYINNDHKGIPLDR